ncbi:Leucine-binding protein domain-containing protein [Gammaproteobacteria bacterium]
MIAKIKLLLASLSGLSKAKLFMLILLVAAGIAVVAVLITDFILFSQGGGAALRLAVVAPLTGDEAALGRAIREGVEVEVAALNQSGGLDGRKLAVVAFDDGNDPERARAAAAEAVKAGAIAVIGHTAAATLSAAEPVYATSQLGIITLTADQTLRTPPPPHPTASRLLADEGYEMRFLANYVRNVNGEKTVHILYEDSPRGESLANTFDETMQRFGTRVLYRWALPREPNALAKQVEATARQLTEGKLPGTVLVIADPAMSARAVMGLRLQGVRNPIAGTRSLATDAFLETLKREWTGTASLESVVTGSLLTVPMLFDVSGQLAQDFRTNFITQFRHAPDWVAAYANDATRVVLKILQAESIAKTPSEVLRARVFEQLSKASASASNVEGLNGSITLNAQGREIRPPLLGTYDGIDLISTLTQLIPIREEGVGNLLQQFVEGRALYVNDRFMYRTNVVYTGAKPYNISELNINDRTIELEFSLWFRWRGDFEPQDIVFTNAVSPIRIEKPEQDKKIGDIKYRSYRVKGKFFMNFSSVARAFDTKLVGITFHHRLLSRHNLMYVNDILGLGMTRNATLQSILGNSDIATARETGVQDLLANLIHSIGHFLYSSANLSDPLIKILSRTNLLAGAPGWMIDKAWISQDIISRSSLGDPNYVGFGRPAPDFSRVEMGVILKPDLIRARDLIPSQFFFDIAIVAGIAALLAFLLDVRYEKHFWCVQTFVLRLIAWPLLLISLGNLSLDYALIYTSPSVVNSIWTAYSIAHWFIPALLATIALERFVWVPLEERTQRKIPNIVRLLTASVVFLFALFGVVAYVFGQTVTSLLATAGLSTMIIGLAIRANIANIFSGIILNLEKPFAIGDKIRVSTARKESIKGKVIDITWRTTLIEHEAGHLVRIPNGKLSEMELHNLSRTESGFLCEYRVYVDPRQDPDKVMPLIKAAIADNPHVILRGGVPAVTTVLLGMGNLGEVQMSIYRVRIYVQGKPDGAPICTKAGELFWKRLWKNFQNAGIVWQQSPSLANSPGSGEGTAQRIEK